MVELCLAGCVIQDNERRLLLLHRNTERFVHWEIPGGKIEPDEDPVKTAERELEEELGVKVEVDKKLGVRTFVDEERQMQVEYIWYKAKIISGKPKVMEPQTHDAIRYFTQEELELAMPTLSRVAQGLLAEVAAGRIKL